jgi:hypothetical protein
MDVIDLDDSGYFEVLAGSVDDISPPRNPATSTSSVTSDRSSLDDHLILTDNRSRLPPSSPS